MKLEKISPDQLDDVNQMADFDEPVELSDDDLENIAGGAGLPSQKPCPTCSSAMKLKGSAGHYVYYCSNCKQLYKATA